ncbi:hypothetical protein DACRYDRAFT_77207 [Dacryopinax primogenitus]|uniref:Translation machinery-associated protein 16 n=1 Tax=Dacryopinax primogenitus (strain DJM 731) TaxID=1858805 RepID=M5GET2_DACPD|nr:uncharacterized protein DACRYDRAFT_77207 [Dacryopinax primogenitus]EJU03563.1 hypothetical protein DACRYDRAFT_77207 [Dacryopinax primogenitus]
MPPTKTKPARSSSSKKGPKEKVFHPESRKAGQLERKLLRKQKLEKASVTKSRNSPNVIVDRNVFFLHALPEDAIALTLSDVHDILRDVWLARFDHLIEAEQAARRSGRPRSTKEDKLLEMKRQNTEEYRTGIDIPDLTHLATVALFRKWNADDPGFLTLLRWIRVTSENPHEVVLVREGNEKALLHAAAAAGLSLDLGQHAVDSALGHDGMDENVVEEELAADLHDLL